MKHTQLILSEVGRDMTDTGAMTVRTTTGTLHITVDRDTIVVTMTAVDWRDLQDLAQTHGTAALHRRMVTATKNAIRNGL